MCEHSHPIIVVTNGVMWQALCLRKPGILRGPHQLHFLSVPAQLGPRRLTPKQHLGAPWPAGFRLMEPREGMARVGSTEKRGWSGISGLSAPRVRAAVGSGLWLCIWDGPLRPGPMPGLRIQRAVWKVSPGREGLGRADRGGRETAGLGSLLSPPVLFGLRWDRMPLGALSEGGGWSSSIAFQLHFPANRAGAERPQRQWGHCLPLCTAPGAGPAAAGRGGWDRDTEAVPVFAEQFLLGALSSPEAGLPLQFFPFQAWNGASLLPPTPSPVHAPGPDFALQYFLP